MTKALETILEILAGRGGSDMPDGTVACELGKLMASMNELKAKIEEIKHEQRAHADAVNARFDEFDEKLSELKTERDETNGQKKLLARLGAVTLAVATFVGLIASGVLNWRKLLGME